MLKGCESCLGCWQLDPRITSDHSPPVCLPRPEVSCRPPPHLPSRLWSLCLSLGYLSCSCLIDSLLWSHISRLTSLPFPTERSSAAYLRPPALKSHLPCLTFRFAPHGSQAGDPYGLSGSGGGWS